MVFKQTIRKRETQVFSFQVGVQHARFDLIIVLPPQILTGPGVHRVEFGDDIILPCQLDRTAVGNVSVTWWFKGKTIKNNRRVSIDHDHSLHISSTDLSDTGEYFCRARNEIGTDAAKVQFAQSK